MKLAATVVLYENCTPEKKAQISRKNWLLHRDRYVKQYYSEHYNRDVQVHNLES